MKIDWFKRAGVRSGQISAPFGFVRHNGMNFAESIHNPKSVIRRLLAEVDKAGVPLTKRDILTRMGYQLNISDPYEYTCHACGTVKSVPHTYHVPRGYLSDYFASCVDAGFLMYFRSGRSVLWTKGVNFPTLEKVITI